MVKIDDLDERYRKYNPDGDYNGAIGLAIVDEIILKYGSIENYEGHLNSIGGADTSKLVQKTNKEDFKPSAKDKEIGAATLANIRKYIQERIERDKKNRGLN